jgi:hypothetical protein
VRDPPHARPGQGIRGAASPDYGAGCGGRPARLPPRPERGTPGGGIWNITDDNGNSKAVNLSSYHVGAYVGRRLTDKLWLNVGGGMTVANNLTYSDPDGDDEYLDEDMDSGFFGQIGLSLKAW